MPNTRLDVPESPSDSRLPSAASASSITTMTGPIARSTESTRSRLPSVSPTYLDRKFLRITHGMPISPAVHCGRDRHPVRSEEHTSELQSRSDLVCRLLLEKKKKKQQRNERDLHTNVRR